MQPHTNPVIIYCKPRQSAAAMDKEKELWGQKFKVVKDGLDEAQVYSFVNSLTNQLLDSDFAKRIDDLNSVVGKLADRYGEVASRLDELNSVVAGQAEKYGDMHRKPAASASTPRQGDLASGIDSLVPKPSVSRKAQRADVREAKDSDPDLFLKDAGQTTEDDVDTEKLEYLDTLTSFAEKTVIEAVKHAKLAKAKMEEKAKARAADIVARAQEKAQEEADRIIAGAMLNAEARAKEIITSAQLRAQEPAASHDLGSILAKARQTAEPAQEEAPAVSAGSERIRIGEEINSDLYAGSVEITLPPPVGLNQMLQLHRHLKENPNVDVLSLTGSVDQGITIKVTVRIPTPLLKMIGELPEVRRAAEETSADGIGPVPQLPGQALLRKIIVNTTV